MTPEALGIVALSLIAGVALAAAAGFRAFLPLLVLSAAAHLGLLIPAGGMRFLESDTALIALAVAALLEILGDKIPVVDHALDVAGTFVRPVAGFLAGLTVFGDIPGGVGVGLSLLLAVITLGTHLGHAKTRVGSTVLTAGVGNPLISVVEDLLALSLSILAVLAPLVAFVLVGLTAYLFWRLWRSLTRHRRTPPSDPGS